MKDLACKCISFVKRNTFTERVKNFEDRYSTYMLQSTHYARIFWN